MQPTPANARVAQALRTTPLAHGVALTMVDRIGGKAGGMMLSVDPVGAVVSVLHTERTPAQAERVLVKAARSAHDIAKTDHEVNQVVSAALASRYDVPTAGMLIYGAYDKASTAFEAASHTIRDPRAHAAGIDAVLSAFRAATDA